MCRNSQHLLNNIKCILADARQILVERLWNVILEPHVLLLGEFVALAPVFLSGRAQYP